MESNGVDSVGHLEEDEVVQEEDDFSDQDFLEETEPSLAPNEGIECGDRRGLCIVKVLAAGCKKNEGEDPGEGMRLSDALQRLDPVMYPSKKAAKKHINKACILVDSMRSDIHTRLALLKLKQKLWWKTKTEGSDSRWKLDDS